MKRLVFICLTLMSTCAFAQITIKKTEGSSVVTDLGFGIKVNKGSSLKREKIILNDVSCPIQLNDVEIEPVYSERSYRFKSIGNFTLKEPIVAYEIHYILYDVFGEHIKTLSGTEIIDLDGNQELPKLSSWYATENNVSEYFICVSYVANVRTKNGQLWRYKYPEIKEKLDKIKISFDEEYLPKKDSEK